MKDPCVLFYTQDFITGTLLMTYEQKGKYITLLCLQQQNGRLSEKDMLKICPERDEEIWTKFVFQDGYYYNIRMDLETKRRSKFRESRTNNLNMSAHMGSHMEIETRNRNNNKKKEELLRKREEKFKSEVFEFSGKYPESMLIKFASYWTEPNKSGMKLKYELEKTWELSRRLSNWASRDKDFDKHKSENLITYVELCNKVSNGEKDAFDKYERIEIPGSKPKWRLKK